MAIGFTVKDIKHKIVTKFIHAFLPEAKKPYNLKAVHMPELGIHEIASKAEIYNMTISPKLIDEGLTAGMELIFYLLADGYRIRLPVCNMGLRIPGEYDGSETRLADGVFPQARLQVSAALREYLKKQCSIVFDGVEQADGYIAQVVDEATDLTDDVVTIGNLLTVRGFGLKIEGDESNAGKTGIFFEPEGGPAVKADIIAVNEPRTLKIIVPAGLQTGKSYTLLIVTQSSAKHGSTLLKNPREVRSDFTLTAQAG